MRLPIATYGRRDCFLAVASFSTAALVVVRVSWLSGHLALAWLAALPLFLASFTASFYRDFERVIPEGAGVVVSPADGTVTDVVEVEERDYLGEKAVRVGIFLSPLN